MEVIDLNLTCKPMTCNLLVFRKSCNLRFSNKHSEEVLNDPNLTSSSLTFNLNVVRRFIDLYNTSEQVAGFQRGRKTWVTSIWPLTSMFSEGLVTYVILQSKQRGSKKGLSDLNMTFYLHVFRRFNDHYNTSEQVAGFQGGSTTWVTFIWPLTFMFSECLTTYAIPQGKQRGSKEGDDLE